METAAVQYNRLGSVMPSRYADFRGQFSRLLRARTPAFGTFFFHLSALVDRRFCQSASNFGSDSISVQKSRAEEIEFRAAVHLAFDEFELGDLTFCLPVGPRFDESGSNRAFVGPEALHEGREQAGRCIMKPGAQLCAFSLTDHRLETLDQLACRYHRRDPS